MTKRFLGNVNNSICYKLQVTQNDNTVYETNPYVDVSENTVQDSFVSVHCTITCVTHSNTFVSVQ